MEKANIIQLNRLHRLSFEDLVIVSKKPMEDGCDLQRASIMINEFSRRLQKETEILTTKVQELKSQLDN